MASMAPAQRLDPAVGGLVAGAAVLAAVLLARRPASGGPGPPPVCPTCGSCQVCTDPSVGCVPVQCPPGQSCDPASGSCVAPPPTCPTCGRCQVCTDPSVGCVPVQCPPAQQCDPVQNTCVTTGGGGGGPRPMPAGAVPISHFGAHPGGDITTALQAAINGAGPGGTVWINGSGGTTPVTYTVSTHTQITHPVTIAGPGRDYVTIVQTTRAGIFGVHSDTVTIQDLTLDTRTHNFTVPPALKNPDPTTIYIVGSRCTVQRVRSITGTGFGIRFTGSNPCYAAPVGGNLASDIILDSYASGGGFVALDIDCQGAGGQWTRVENIVTTGTMAIYLASFVQVNGFNFTPNRFQKSCAPCIEVSSTQPSPSHDIAIANVQSQGGKVRIELYNGAPPIHNLSLPSGQYWKQGC